MPKGFPLPKEARIDLCPQKANPHEVMIDYKNELNPAQYEAATTLEGPMLVIAGAGSGKTRTLVYRLANMIEQGVSPHEILLLTFTRKASQEMLQRATELLGHSVGNITGGTFHAFAYSVLRQNPPKEYEGSLSIMDSADANGALKYCKDTLAIGKGDKSFPKIQTVMGMLSKSRNKEMDLHDILRREAFHLAAYRDDIANIGSEYEQYKAQHGLLDYDDLLFKLEQLLTVNKEVREYYQQRFKYIMVDEYQDTNLVQARIVRLLAGGHGNVMAVGDDAQSIYAFRGANVQNILDFPKLFPGCKMVKLEENYRSIQPILDLTNSILAEAPQAFQKNLFSNKKDGRKPEVLIPLSDLTQAKMVVDKIGKLRKKYKNKEIAVLFRAGYQSYHVEMQLNKLGLKFRKYGGLKYSDAAHVKDVMSYVRLLMNPLDLPAFNRLTANIKGVGPKTSLRIYEATQAEDPSKLQKALVRYPELREDLDLIDSLRRQRLEPVELLEEVLVHYKPKLKTIYPDDYPRREHGLEQLVQIASGYSDIDLFLSDLSLEDPTQKKDEEDEDLVTLSTIHSAKGLEWDAVLIIDLVEDRFPSRHAVQKADEFEEERRLMYVACTRARKYLGLFVPSSLYARGTGGNEPAIPSPFVRDIPSSMYEEWRENYSGTVTQTARPTSTPPHRAPKQNGKAAPKPTAGAPSSTSVGGGKLGHCTHKIFGRGKIIQHLPPDKYRVNFPGFGLKVIMEAYLVMED